MSCSDHLGRTKGRAALLFVAVVVAAGLVHVATAWAAPAADVTLRMERFYDNACRCYKLRFSGTIASQAANEYVTIVRQECGSRSATAIAGASTRAGGLWEAEPVIGARPEFDSSSYRARWNGRLSEPLTFRGKLQISLAELGRGRYRVAVSTDQKMKGRPVELQRLVGGQWRRLRSARLAPFRGDFAAWLPSEVTSRRRSRCDGADLICAPLCRREVRGRATPPRRRRRSLQVPRPVPAPGRRSSTGRSSAPSQCEAASGYSS